MLLRAETPALPERIDYDPDLALARLRRPAHGRSIVVGQLGQSLDGRIATPTGASKYINGTEALRHLHRIRASVDAVVVGVGTAIADDPQLTTRHVPGPNATRVVIDPKGRLPRHLRMLQDGVSPVIVISPDDAVTPDGAERLAVQSTPQGHMCPVQIVRALSARGMRKILVEGGAETLARFLNAGAIDELHLMVAPIVLGSGKTGLNLDPIESLDEAVRPRVRTMRFEDGELLCLCEMPQAS